MFLKVKKFNEKTNKKQYVLVNTPCSYFKCESTLIHSFIFTSPVISLIARHVAIILLLKHCLKKAIIWNYFHLPHFVF